MKPTHEWSISERLGLGFALMLATLAVLVVAIVRGNALSAQAQNEVTGRIAPLEDAAQVVELRVLSVAIGVRTYLFHPTPEMLRQHQVQVEEARQALRRLEELPMESQSALAFERLAPQVRDFLAAASQLVNEQTLEAQLAGERALEQRRERVLESASVFSRHQRTRMLAALAGMQTARAEASVNTGLAVGLCVLVFALLALLMVRSVREPAQRLVEIAWLMQQGDWKSALAWAPKPNGHRVKDELLELAHALRAAAVALERREQRLRADGRVASATGSSLSKEEISRAALGAICDHVQAEVGALYWREAGAAELTPIAERGIKAGPSTPLGTGKVTLGEGIPGRAASERRTVLVQEVPADSGFSVNVGPDQAPPRCVAAVPVMVHEQLLGVLLVASLRALDAEAVSFLEAAALQLGIGLKNVAAYEQIKKVLVELGEKSEQVQAQNEGLQAQNEELQAQGKEIHAQNDELKAATEQLRSHATTLTDVDRRRTEFLGVLAHELSNPLAAISMSLYALLDSGGNPETRGRAEQVIGRQTRLLTRLVEDLLDVTRISNG